MPRPSAATPLLFAPDRDSSVSLIIGETEPWFKQRVVEMMNQIIRERSLGFDRADAEQSIPMGRKHKFADAILWKSAGSEPACEMELKRPFIDAADFELVENAAAKANAIGAPYFLTWNVRDLVLWETFVPGKPLLDRRCRWWSNIIDVADVTDLRDLHWERLRAFLNELLDELDGLYNRGKRFERLPIDEFFVRKLRSVVASNYRIYAAVTRKRCLADGRYYGDLRKWASLHGWSALFPPDAAKADPSAFDVLGRLAIFLLMNRVIFYDLVRTKHHLLPAMSFDGVRSGRDFEARLRRYFDAVLRIDFATVFATDIFDRLLVPDGSVPQL